MLQYSTVLSEVIVTLRAGQEERRGQRREVRERDAPTDTTTLHTYVHRTVAGVRSALICAFVARDEDSDQCRRVSSRTCMYSRTA